LEGCRSKESLAKLPELRRQFGESVEALAWLSDPKPASFNELWKQCALEAAAVQLSGFPHLDSLQRYSWIDPEHQATLAMLLTQLESLRVPVFGFLFSRSRVANLGVQVFHALGG